MAGHEIFDEGVDGADGQRGHGMLEAEHIGDVGACQREGLLPGIAEADARIVGVAPRDEGQQHRAAVHVEEHPVDRLDLDGGRVDVAHLGQAPAGRVVCLLLRGQGLLQLLPVGLGRCQRVVAVAHGQRQRGCAPGLWIPGIKDFLTAQPLQGRVDLGQQSRVFHGPARDVPAAQHQFAFVDLAQRVFLHPDGLDEGAVRVVGQHHDVGRFQAGPAPDGHPGRDAALDRVFAGAHLRLGTLGVAVGFKVDFPHQPLPDAAALLGALHIDKAVHRAGQHRAKIVVHGLMDLLDAAGHAALFQIHFRQDQVQGAGRTCRCPGRFFPIRAVARKLIAGHAAPLLQRDILRREQDVCRRKARCFVHITFLPLALLKGNRSFYS